MLLLDVCCKYQASRFTSLAAAIIDAVMYSLLRDTCIEDPRIAVVRHRLCGSSTVLNQCCQLLHRRLQRLMPNVAWQRAYCALFMIAKDQCHVKYGKKKSGAFKKCYRGMNTSLTIGRRFPLTWNIRGVVVSSTCLKPLTTPPFWILNLRKDETS